MPDAKTVLARFSLMAMSNLRSNRTGVEGAVVWCSSGEFEGKSLPHGPRLKVVLGSKVTHEGLVSACSVTLELHPRVIGGKLPAKTKRQTKEFIVRNLDTLLGYWTGELDTADMIEQLV